VQVTLGVDPLLLTGAILALSAVVRLRAGHPPFPPLPRPRRAAVPRLGMLFGTTGSTLISLDDAELVQNVGVVALLFILLEGGLTTKPTDLGSPRCPGPARHGRGRRSPPASPRSGCGCCSTSTWSRPG
jgi:potassium/hydrogen antiporter